MSDLTLILIIAQLLIFLLLAILNPLLVPLNLLVRAYVDSRRNPRLRPLMILTHRYYDILSLSIQLLVTALLLGLIWTDWGRAAVLLSAMFAVTTIVSGVKRLTSIERPPQLASHVFLTTGSYPSGHSASSMMSALLVPTVLMPYLPLTILIMLTTILICVVLLVAYGRLYLDVHWLTDIVGGWVLAGAVYLFSCQFIT